MQMYEIEQIEQLFLVMDSTYMPPTPRFSAPWFAAAVFAIASRRARLTSPNVPGAIARAAPLSPCVRPSWRNREIHKKPLFGTNFEQGATRVQALEPPPTPSLSLAVESTSFTDNYGRYNVITGGVCKSSLYLTASRSPLCVFRSSTHQLVQFPDSFQNPGRCLPHNPFLERPCLSRRACITQLSSSH